MIVCKIVIFEYSTFQLLKLFMTKASARNNFGSLKCTTAKYNFQTFPAFNPPDPLTTRGGRVAEGEGFVTVCDCAHGNMWDYVYWSRTVSQNGSTSQCLDRQRGSQGLQSVIGSRLMIIIIMGCTKFVINMHGCLFAFVQCAHSRSDLRIVFILHWSPIRL